MFHVVLLEPEIPPNTGNVIRLCANTGATLHLVRPLGFTLDKRSLRRAGLDYHDMAQVHVHADLAACRNTLGERRWFAIETGGANDHAALSYTPGDVLLFGPERAGLSAAVLACVPPERHITIPMRPGNRSLNLANAVAVVVYEAWRQQGFTQASLAPG